MDYCEPSLQMVNSYPVCSGQVYCGRSPDQNIWRHPQVHSVQRVEDVLTRPLLTTVSWVVQDFLRLPTVLFYAQGTYDDVKLQCQIVLHATVIGISGRYENFLMTMFSSLDWEGSPASSLQAETGSLALLGCLESFWKCYISPGPLCFWVCG